eukprot:PhM_4_TR11641/c2_g1_i1/m.68203
MGCCASSLQVPLAAQPNGAPQRHGRRHKNSSSNNTPNGIDDLDLAIAHNPIVAPPSASQLSHSTNSTNSAQDALSLSGSSRKNNRALRASSFQRQQQQQLHPRNTPTSTVVLLDDASPYIPEVVTSMNFSATATTVTTHERSYDTIEHHNDDDDVREPVLLFPLEKIESATQEQRDATALLGNKHGILKKPYSRRSSSGKASTTDSEAVAMHSSSEQAASFSRYSYASSTHCSSSLIASSGIIEIYECDSSLCSEPDNDKGDGGTGPTTAARPPRVKFAHITDDDSDALERSDALGSSSGRSPTAATQQQHLQQQQRGATKSMDEYLSERYVPATDNSMPQLQCGRFTRRALVVRDTMPKKNKTPTDDEDGVVYVLKEVSLPSHLPLGEPIDVVGQLRSLHHPCLVRTHRVYDDATYNFRHNIATTPSGSTPPRVIVLTEFMDMGPIALSTSLSSYVPTVPTSMHINHIRAAFRDVLYALQYLHRKGVVHGNIRPENILVYGKGMLECGAKLADVGLTPPGHSAFVPPEGMSRAMTREADMWGLGMSMYIALVGTAPTFGIGTDGQHVVDLRPLGPKCPLEVSDALRRLLCRDPANRISVDVLLGHPLFAAQSSKVSLKLYITVWKERKLEEAKNNTKNKNKNQTI